MMAIQAWRWMEGHPHIKQSYIIRVPEDEFYYHLPRIAAQQDAGLPAPTIVEVDSPEPWSDYGLDEPMLQIIGSMVGKSQDAPIGTPTTELAWRVGYQNALADLIAELAPTAPGGRRLTIDEMIAEDRRRQR